MTKKLPLLLLIVALALMVSCNPDAANDPKENAKASSSGLTKQMVQGEDVSGIKLEVTLGEGYRFIKSIMKGEDVTPWFANLPTGVRAKAYAPDMAGNKGLGGKDADSGDEKSKMDFSGEGITFYAVKEGDTSLTVEFNGTVDDVPEEPMTFTIPAEYTNANVDIVVGVSGGSSGNLPVIKICSITFKHNYGIEDRKVSVRSGEKVDNYNPADREGFTFDGWYTDEGLTKKYDFNTNVKGDIVLWAKWTPNTSEGVEKPIIEVSGTGFGVYTVTITNPNYSTIPHMYYTLDGSYPDPSEYSVKAGEKGRIKQSDSKETIIEVSSGTIITALNSFLGKTSDVAVEVVPGKGSFYIIGTETKIGRVFDGDGKMTSENSHRYTVFNPYKYMDEDVSKDIVKGSGIGDDFNVIEVFEYDDDKLLVVANHSNYKTDRPYFYFFANRNNGHYDNGEVYSINSGNRIKAESDIIFSKTNDKFAIITEKSIYFVDISSNKTETVASDSSEHFKSGYLNGDDLYVFGRIDVSSGFKAAFWKYNLKNNTKEIKQLEVPDGSSLTGKSYQILVSTLKDGSLYLVVDGDFKTSKNDGIAKELWKYDLSTNTVSFVSKMSISNSYDFACVHNILVYNGKLVLTGGYRKNNSNPSDHRVFIPCIWDENWNPTDDFKQPDGFINASIERVQIINGDLYLLSNVSEVADAGSDCKDYYMWDYNGKTGTITHGIVWKYGDPNFIIEVGSGFYNLGLSSTIAYLSL